MKREGRLGELEDVKGRADVAPFVRDAFITLGESKLGICLTVIFQSEYDFAIMKRIRNTFMNFSRDIITKLLLRLTTILNRVFK